MEILCIQGATSIVSKFHNFLIFSTWRCFLGDYLFSSSSLVNYNIININKKYWNISIDGYLIKTIGSSWLWLYLIYVIAFVNLVNHIVGDYLRPYRAFLSLKTRYSGINFLKHEGTTLQISFSRSPCRKSLFTSQCCNFQPTTEANSSLMEPIFATRENVCEYSSPYICVCPFATNVTLYLSSDPS